jgi:DNA-binding transcriptional ArsR family regulator
MARPDDATQMLRPGSKDRRVTITLVSADPQQMGDADLAAVGALLAEPARAKVLLALADGRSLAASVLALEAGVAPSTASHHLAKLVEAGLISATARGRHRYFMLAGPRVGELIEAVARVAPDNRSPRCDRELARTRSATRGAATTTSPGGSASPSPTRFASKESSPAATPAPTPIMRPAAVAELETATR